MEIDNITKIHDLSREQLQTECNRLKLLIQVKNEELKDLYEQNERVLAQHKEELQLMRN